jgi:hypothetical protein
LIIIIIILELDFLLLFACAAPSMSYLPPTFPFLYHPNALSPRKTRGFFFFLKHNMQSYQS